MYIHLLVLEEGIPLVGKEFPNGDWAAGNAMLKGFRGTFVIFFEFMNEVKSQCRMYIKHTINKKIYKSS
jgi:hypothetical protein